MDEQNQNEDYGLETQDYIDADVEYVSTESNNTQFIDDAQVTTDTDFDYPQTVPDYPAQSYDDLPPTQPISMAQDFLELSQQMTSEGDELAKAQALENFSQKQIARFTSPKVIGPLLLFYAYRGRFSTLERVVIAAIGVGAALKGYGMTKPGQGLDHPLMKTVKGRIVG